MSVDWLEDSEKVIREKMTENTTEKPPVTRSGILKLYPLANPKGTYIFCDVCGLPAWLRCKGCKIASYCNREHRLLDWMGIHRYLCKSLIYLYNPPTRSIRKLQQQALERSILNTKLDLINMCLLHGNRHLFEGNYKLIIPPALQCLRLYKMLYKPESIEWLPAYLLLAECLLGLGQTNEAANYLSLINWFETKNKVTGIKCNHMVKRTMAKLSMVRENYQQALDELAEDVYLASEKYGTLDIQTSGGYFNMANVYYFLGREEVTNSLYKKVIDIWCKHLQGLVNQKMKTSTPDIALPIKVEEYEALNEADSAEARMYFDSIGDWWESIGEGLSYYSGKLAYCRAMHLFVLSKIKEAYTSAKKTVVFLNSIPDCEALLARTEDLILSCEKKAYF